MAGHASCFDTAAHTAVDEPLVLPQPPPALSRNLPLLFVLPFPVAPVVVSRSLPVPPAALSRFLPVALLAPFGFSRVFPVPPVLSGAAPALLCFASLLRELRWTGRFEGSQH